MSAQSQPSGAREPISRAAPIACDLCGDAAEADDFNATAGMTICPRCLEDMLHASAFDARAEVGLVGSGGVRS